MVALKSWHTLDIFQFLFRSFHDLKQNTYESTLWVCDGGASQPFILDLQETVTLLILKIQFYHSENSLDLQITPETVLVRGNRLDPLGKQDFSPASLFQSLIPLPSSIQPQTAIAELDDKTLTLILTKSHATQRTAKITVGDRSQQLPYAMAITATSATPEWN